MLKACKLTSPLSTAFGDAWKLYKASFPREERRPLRLHAQAMQQESSFHCYTFYSDDTFVGLLFYWEFSTCIYIEHLAVNIMNRGQGNGAKILDFVHQQGKPVILEIEPLTDAATESRLHFYEKTGYHLLPYEHYQLPYHHHDEPLSLLLLSYPQVASTALVEEFETEYAALPMRYRQHQEP